ncbi:ribbon-helix-helix protein, CopG family [Novosphingobium resinovorum]|uniref:CopG family transcriptional regulator n=1 Tax=Novosphingobium resinovorum TaxID=158500 RepID=A0A1D8A2L4_9SPHN|nr:ribbon-helix-helix protein, CopG family [Novosphingobium resinovorum]AOR76373.1 CopG family transcriptional regulator [Novosphingobium resinovorum]
MVRKVRHQLFLPEPVAERLAQAAERRGVTRSALLARAVTMMLEQGGQLEIDQQFTMRLDGLGRQLDRLTRDSHIELETLAVFIRYVLMVLAPLSEHDHAGKLAGSARFEAFVSQVGRRVKSGDRTLDGSRP